MILDIAIGILLGTYFNTGETINYFLITMAILFSLLPDIDIFYFLYQKYIKKTNIIDHRSWTHYPIVYLPIYFLIMSLELFFTTNHTISSIFALAILWHFVHDTLFIGWGVMWGFPFSKRKYKIFPDKNGKVTSKVLLTWLPKDEAEIVKWSGGSMKGWLKHYYFKFNIVSALEYGVFILVLVFVYFKYFML